MLCRSAFAFLKRQDGLVVASVGARWMAACAAVVAAVWLALAGTGETYTARKERTCGVPSAAAVPRAAATHRTRVAVKVSAQCRKYEVYRNINLF